jgi:enoyl-CoA hydratase
MSENTPLPSEERFIGYDVLQDVAWIELRRPEVGNAQNFRLLGQLEDAFRAAVDDDAVKVIVVGGAGKHFSAGHDLGSPGRDRDRPRQRHSLWYSHLDKPGVESQYVLEQDAYLGFCRRWQEIPKPTIAMVQGACIGAGLMLAWVCDLIVAADDAFFQDPTVLMGFPGAEYFAHAYELPTRIAREFLMLGERMTAERAHHFGMVNRVVPRDSLRDEVSKMAARIAERPRFGLALCKQALNLVEEMRGKRTAMDAVFHNHHLAHAHSQLIHGDRAGGMNATSMRDANKK